MADTDGSSTGANCLEKLKSYAKTQKGSILAGEILISFIVIICYCASHSGGYSSVPIVEMILAIVFFGIFMMGMDKQFLAVNWMWTDLFRAGIGAVLYLAISLINLFGSGGDGARIAAGVFGVIATVLFGYDTYTRFLEIKSTRQHTAASTDDRV